MYVLGKLFVLGTRTLVIMFIHMLSQISPLKPCCAHTAAYFGTF